MLLSILRYSKCSYCSCMIIMNDSIIYYSCYQSLSLWLYVSSLVWTPVKIPCTERVSLLGYSSNHGDFAGVASMATTTVWHTFRSRIQFTGGPCWRWRSCHRTWGGAGSFSHPTIFRTGAAAGRSTFEKWSVVGMWCLTGRNVHRYFSSSGYQMWLNGIHGLNRSFP